MPEPRISTGQRARVVERAKACCEYCQSQERYSPDPFSVEHIIPLYHPRQHNWADHFAWSDDGALILGLTPIGRAAVEKLQLNRAGLVNLRRVLVDAGEHPPVF